MGGKQSSAAVVLPSCKFCAGPLDPSPSSSSSSTPISSSSSSSHDRCCRCGGVQSWSPQSNPLTSVTVLPCAPHSSSSSSSVNYCTDDTEQDILAFFDAKRALSSAPSSSFSSSSSSSSSASSSHSSSSSMSMVMSMGMIVPISSSLSVKVSQCMPVSGGYLTHETFMKVRRTLLHPISTPLTRIHLLPTLTSLKQHHRRMNPRFYNADGTLSGSDIYPQQQFEQQQDDSMFKLDDRTLFNDHIKPYFAQLLPNLRHVHQGCTFVSEGVELVVVACQPNGGLVCGDTEFFTEGVPLHDLDKLHVLPIFESLPNNEKNITPQASFAKYILPFFTGTRRFVAKHERLEIDGVFFRVVACSPAEGGVVTLETEIFSEGVPLKSDDIRRQQEMEDEAMARRLQMQENVMDQYMMGDPFVIASARPISQLNTTYRGNVVLASNSNMNASRGSLTSLLRSMPPNDPNRIYVQQMLLRSILAGLPIEHFLRQQQPQNAGATQEEIDALPTFPFRKPPSSASASFSSTTTTAASSSSSSSSSSVDEGEKNTCRVCLSSYEEDEELRTLPCLHYYHKECIDAWLERNKRCPVCKNPIA